MIANRAVAPMTVERVPAWLSWVGSTKTCLRALGEDVDAADVAAVSGYAFALTINDGVCVSGPTCVDWCALSTGIALGTGRSVTSFVSFDCFVGDRKNDRTRRHAREVFDLARREVSAGRPCVVWGLGVPEFGVVRGVEGDDYLCVAGGPTPERSRWDAIDAPGGPAIWAFPTRNERWPGADRFAVRGAVQAITRLSTGEKEICGLAAYDAWIEHLGAGRANRWGHSYNTQCWAEARTHARDWLSRAADRNDAAGPALHQSRTAYVEVAAALGELAERFPFTMDPGEIDDPGAIEAGIGLLRRARAAEERALESLISALTEWPDPA